MALALVALVYAVLFLYYLQATVIVQPFWDMFAHVLRYLDYREGGSWWAYLWEPHVQHRHVWIRLLTAFDVEAFSGAAYPFVVSSAACQGVTAWLLWRESQRVEPPELRSAAGSFVVMLVLTSVSAVVCAIPMDAVYPQAVMFSVLALVLFDGREDASGATNRALAWRRAAAVLAAAAAAFANAVTLTLWPIIAWTAWRGRAGRAWTLGVPIVGALFIAGYVYGLPLADQGTAQDTANLADREWYLRVDYLLAYMGLPWTRAAPLAVPGRIAGAMLLLTGVWAVVWRGFVRPSRGRLERLAVGLIMFSLASGALAAIGRLDIGSDVTVPVRYSLFLTPLHAGVLFLAVPWVTRQWAVEARRPVIRALMLAAACLLVVQQIAAGQAAAATTRTMRTTIQRFVDGEQDPGMEQVVFDDLDEARRASDRIRAAGLYLKSR